MTKTTAATSSQDIVRIEPSHRLRGEYRPPADKSISHRALILAAMAAGRSTVSPVSGSADVASTAHCLRTLGVRIDQTADAWIVESPGITGWRQPSKPLECGNSGTTMRLLTGCLAGCPLTSTLTGDASLNRRPMLRIADPLRAMGAMIELSDDGTPPVTVTGGALRGIDYELPVASAQVKSALLFAGLTATDALTINERHVSRDHTELMFKALDIPCVLEHPPRYADERERLLDPSQAVAWPEGIERRIRLQCPAQSRPHEWRIPGDFSAAAFFIGAALGVRQADLTIDDVLLNPTRIGLLKVLKRMGAEIESHRESARSGEPFGRIRVSTCGELKATRVGESEIATLIDELPVLAVVAANAHGVTVIRGAGELRSKESDRIAAVAVNLRAMGAKVAELEDGWAIEGPTEWHGASLDSFGDHRIAMAFAVAALWADGPSEIRNAHVAAVSDPEFFAIVRSLTQ